jgi:hypothetical protein
MSVAEGGRSNTIRGNWDNPSQRRMRAVEIQSVLMHNVVNCARDMSIGKGAFQSAYAAVMLDEGDGLSMWR